MDSLGNGLLLTRWGNTSVSETRLRGPYTRRHSLLRPTINTTQGQWNYGLHFEGTKRTQTSIWVF